MKHFVIRLVGIVLLFGFLQIITVNSALAKHSTNGKELVEESINEINSACEFELEESFMKSHSLEFKFDFKLLINCLQHLFYRNAYTFPIVDFPKLPPEIKYYTSVFSIVFNKMYK
jgi:hypothetical protein